MRSVCAYSARDSRMRRLDEKWHLVDRYVAAAVEFAAHPSFPALPSPLLPRDGDL